MIPAASAFPTPTRAGFHTTQWSLVSKAGGDASQEVNEALNELCQAYWRPIYAEVRRRGLAVADAQDLTQEFFARLLRRQSFGRADQQRGRFRTFLLAALDHVLADQWRDQNALKRGAGAVILSLDAAEGETWYQQLTQDSAGPAEQFDQRWALILMDRALQCLREDYEKSGRTTLFALLKPFLATDAGADGYAQAAEQSGMTESTFRVAVHRFRKRFRESVRQQVETTVADPSETDAEMRHLFGV
jgi:RNA polymerase sigma factor (sigma-70 family)